MTGGRSRVQLLRVLSDAGARRDDNDAWKELIPGRIFHPHRSMVRTSFIAVERLWDSNLSRHHRHHPRAASSKWSVSDLRHRGPCMV